MLQGCVFNCCFMLNCEYSFIYLKNKNFFRIVFQMANIYLRNPIVNCQSMHQKVGDHHIVTD